MINSVQYSRNQINNATRKQNINQKTAPVSFTAAAQTVPMSQDSILAQVYKSLFEFQQMVKAKDPNNLSIYYYNDPHGNSDQMAGILNSAQEFKKEAEQNGDANFVLSAGDNCSGDDVLKNEFIFDLMQNIIGVDVSAVGNHEADAGANGFVEAARDKNVKFVASNVEFSEDNPMREFVKKSIIKEKNGVKYGFVGTMPIDFETCSKADVQKGINVMDFDHTVEAVQKEIDNLKKQGINRIILLSHIGYEEDKKLVGNLDGVDIVIGGHTHVKVDGAKEGENVLKTKSGEPVLITQAGENGKYYGILNVEFNDEGVLEKVDNKLVESNSLNKSPVVENIKEQKLGKSEKVARIKDIHPAPENRKIEPTAWTCLFADSMKEELGGDIAIINSANVRKVPKPGILTKRDIQEAAPMGNNLIKAKITQKQLVEAVENAAKNTMSSYDGYPGLLQGSGFTYKIDDTGKLLEMNILDKEGNKTPVDINNPSEDITYDTVYDTFTAKPDGETPELAPKFGVEEFDFDKNETLANYLSKLPNKDDLEVKFDNRIEIQKTSQPKPKGNSSRRI